MKLLSSFRLGVVAMALCFGVRSQATVFDLSADFSTNSNPSGPWSYGYKTNVSGNLVLFGFKKFSPDDNGLLLFDWAKNTSEPSAVYFNPSTNINGASGGGGVYPPRTVWVYPGVEGHSDNYGAIRFTVPASAAGTYLLKSTVQ